MKYTIDKNDTKEHYGIKLYRIICETAFANVKEGEKGGYIESEKNLNQSGNALVSGNAWVYDNALVYDNARVYGNAWVSGNARVSGNAEVAGNAQVAGNADLLVISPIGSRNAALTVFKQKDGSLMFTTGCFYGTAEELLIRADETHDNSIHGIAYKNAVKFAQSFMLTPVSA